MDRNPQPERKKDGRERDRLKTQSYIFQEYHPLKATFEEVFMQTGDKEVFRRSIAQKKGQVGYHQGRYY